MDKQPDMEPNVFELHTKDLAERNLIEDSEVLPFTKPTGLQDEPILAVLEAEWRGLFRGASLPRRADVTAALLGNALPYAFIAEKIAPGHARLRVAGRKVSDLFGCEAKGMPLSCLISPAHRAQFQENLKEVFEKPALIEIPLESKRAMGRPGLTGHMVLMPLTDHTGAVTLILGGLVLDGATGIRPRRLDYVDELPLRREFIQQTRPQLDTPRPHLKLVVDNT